MLDIIFLFIFIPFFITGFGFLFTLGAMLAIYIEAKYEIFKNY